MKMRGLFLTAGTFAVTTAVITNAWMQKKQFYPTVVYLTKSSACMAVLYAQAFVFVLLLGKLMRKLFFGQLRPAETEHLIERSWYAVTDTCLAFTLFRDDFSPLFVASFTLLLFLKCFHWLLEDRVDFMERSPVITLLFKIRVLSLLAILFVCDVLFVTASYHVTFTKGASVQLVFGFEYAILATIVLTVFLKYLLHVIDLQSDNPWENKTAYMLYAEVVTGFLRVVLYVCFTVIMAKVHTFPLFSVRPMYLTMRQFKKSMSDIILSRRAIRNMSTLYPDATAEELANTDQTCIICREDMQANTEPEPGRPSEIGANKKLPCGHIFHSSCLRSWFQRQQTCPTCRLDVLQAQQTPPTPEPEQPADGARVQQPRPNIPPHPFGAMFPPPNMFPPPPNIFPGAPPPQPTTSTPPPGSNPPQTGAFPGFVPPMMSSFMMPPPMPPANLSSLSEEQLRAMEGSERRGVEARIECLRNISLLLDAAVTHVQRYCTVAQTQGGQGFQIPAFPNLHTPQPQNTEPGNLPQTFASSSDLPQTSASSSDLPQTSASSSNLPQTSSYGLPQKSAETLPQTAASSQLVEELTLPRNSTPPNNENDSSSDNGVSEPNASELRRRRLAKLQPQPVEDGEQH